MINTNCMQLLLLCLCLSRAIRSYDHVYVLFGHLHGRRHCCSHYLHTNAHVGLMGVTCARAPPESQKQQLSSEVGAQLLNRRQQTSSGPAAPRRAESSSWMRTLKGSSREGAFKGFAHIAIWERLAHNGLVGGKMTVT